MRVHVSPFFIIVVALLFVSGTVGCRNTGGGPWYNPSTYSFSNPFNREGQNPSAASNTPQKVKPTLGETPNINTPPGGFTEGTSLAERPGSIGGTVSSTPPDHWGQQNHVAPTSNSSFGGYTVPEASQYAPYNTGMYDGQGQGGFPAPHVYQNQQQYPPQQNPAPNQYPQYQGEAAQPVGNPAPYNVSPTYGAVPPQGGGFPHPSSQLQGDYAQTGNYAPIGITSDPYAPYAMQSMNSVQQPGLGGYEQPMPAPYQQGIPTEGVSIATPHQVYPAQSTTGGLYGF
jgi:hypothetical protein